MLFPEQKDGETGQAVIGDHTSEWAKNEMPEKQLFEIQKEDDHYFIIWNHTYALTYGENGIFWKEADDSSTQWWKMEPVF